jgi:hypothetical protein
VPCVSPQNCLKRSVRVIVSGWRDRRVIAIVTSQI